LISSLLKQRRHVGTHSEEHLIFSTPFFMNTVACNETADKLSKKGTTLHTKEMPFKADTLKKLLNRKIAKKYKQEANELATTKKWRDIHKIWAEYKGKARKEAAANFRLKTGHDCLAVHLRKISIYESSVCTICQMLNSTMHEEHLLHCPKLDTDQQVLKNTIKLYWDAQETTRKLHYLS